MSKRKQLRDKDFLDELRGFAEAQRQLIQARCDGFDPDPEARAARVEQARADFRFFCRTYFPHYITQAESLFHAWFFDTVPRKIDERKGYFFCISAPRGEGKSTLALRLLFVWCVVTDRKHFMPVVSDSWDQAALLLEAIKAELSDNPRLAMDFPHATGRGRVWNTGVILTANNRKLQAFGRGKPMRGISHGPHRPDLVGIDDLENDENVKQLKQRDKIEKWLLGTVLPLGPPEGGMDVVYPNTILHFDSVANRVHGMQGWLRRRFKAIVQWPDRMDLWEQWEELFLNAERPGEEAAPEDDALTDADLFYAQHRAEMDAGAVVSWPSVRPLIELMKIRARGHHAFDCEYQNDPSNEENGFFTNMQFWVHRDAKWQFYGVLDPSLGKASRKGDPAALLVGGWRRDLSKLSIVEALVSRMPPDVQMQRLIELHRLYRCICWGVEDTAFQEYFRQQIVKQSAAQGIPIPAVAVKNETDKDVLIESIAPHVNNGLIVFHQAHTVLNRQTRHWPEADHDDGPDAVQMLWRMCLRRAGGIPVIRTGKRKS